MRRNWLSFLLIAGLLGLLVVLATLQYRWLGQISNAERERLEKNLQSDSNRFADDFNRLMQTAYYSFQFDANIWRGQNWAAFNERYEFWRQKGSYPDMFAEFYFVPAVENAATLRYAPDGKIFEPVELPEDLRGVRAKLGGDDFPIFNETNFTLQMPIYESAAQFKQIIIKTLPDETNDKIAPPVTPRKKIGALIIKLDEKIFAEQIFPDLAQKYFSPNESANYKIAVADERGETIFQTQTVAAPDASVKFFNLSPDVFNFFTNRELPTDFSLPSPEANKKKKKTVVVSRVESNQVFREKTEDGEQRIEINVAKTDDKAEIPRMRIFQADTNKGVWTLNVQHADGSLAAYVNHARNKNLAVGFGILLLLATSVALIFWSAQRAKMLARRQVEFVSSVSHEFRTPLAVIRAAGENLSDGVIREENKINDYGNLIVREGKKMSAMVEQILEFAGARSGKRKYDFRAVDATVLIDEAIAECQPLIEEKKIEIERDIMENLPFAQADAKALTQAIQNLLINAIKYGDRANRLKISARNGGNALKISVRDFGIGIEKRELGKIFAPFYRAREVVDAQIHGNGLGLSLVKQIVEAHGGKITVKSEIGAGSEFTIILPL